MRRRAAAGLALVAVCAAGCGGAGARAPVPLRVSVSGDGLVPALATGIVVGRGRVLTVAHALDGGGAVRVDGRAARLLRRDARLDLALLAVPGVRGRAVRFGAAGGPAAVDVLRGGRPRALAAGLRRRVTATVRGPDGARARPALELAAAVRPGDSGAPVTDAAGRVLGIVFARADAGPPTAWAVDASAVRRLLAAA
jgi:S1-C subfamily serine protease